MSLTLDELRGLDSDGQRNYFERETRVLRSPLSLRYTLRIGARSLFGEDVIDLHDQYLAALSSSEDVVMRQTMEEREREDLRRRTLQKED